MTDLMLAFGDSVPAGGGGCYTNFVTEYARLLPVPPLTWNHSVSGSTSSDLLVLINKPSILEQLSQASLVLIMTGANDYSGLFDSVCVNNGPYDLRRTILQNNLYAVVSKIRAKNATTQIVLFDYWAAMKDGQVMIKEYTPSQIIAANMCTASANAAISGVVKELTGVKLLSTYAVFNEPNGEVTNLLQPDGNHPNAAGHELIAQALLKLV